MWEGVVCECGSAAVLSMWHQNGNARNHAKCNHRQLNQECGEFNGREGRNAKTCKEVPNKGHKGTQGTQGKGTMWADPIYKGNQIRN